MNVVLQAEQSMILPAIHAFIDSLVLSCIHAPYFASCFCNVGTGTRRVSSSLTYAPDALATCSYLYNLANLSGTIPPEIGGMTSLKDL